MSELDAVLSLHENLAALEVARTRLAGVPDWMRELHDEHVARRSEIEAEQAAADEAEHRRREAEAEVEDLQEKLKRYQQQIGQVTTQREYGALLKEIDTVKAQIKAAEEQAMEAIDANDASKKKVETLRQDFQALDERYQAELAKWEEEKPGVEATAEQLEARVEELRADVPGPVLRMFERMWERTGGDPLARVERVESRAGNAMWHCTACNFNVRPQIVVEIKNGRIHHCDACKRILFWSDGDEA